MGFTDDIKAEWFPRRDAPTQVQTDTHNVSYIRHAESTLALSAADQFPPGYLWQCTIVVYAASAQQLMELTGPNNATNFTPADDCVQILQGSQKHIEVMGPLDGWSQRVMDDADWFWSKTEARVEAAKKELPPK
ncbi:hypothetical protein INS49_012061 [Diaporthe citri]|uniref:uncharacterized protein n=1 Tax=Diaporthe citri TaxID=83186 RepID=UPI001C8010D3|nr:uncharacterized protein INS49_012061 [Diaporthe citri]KAG6358544.1 hypothetical protein INS49_012061 [Diaporthe citri]